MSEGGSRTVSPAATPASSSCSSGPSAPAPPRHKAASSPASSSASRPPASLQKATAGSELSAEERIRQLEREKAALQERLDFVEELIGPTEAQRKELQDKVLAARSAALRAKYRGAAVPTKVAGRLDDRLMAAVGLSERDVALLQGGCLPDKEGILQDVSLLGDPGFRPYDEHTGAVRWQARGGVLQMSMNEVRSRFGEDVAQDVVRCSQELDRYDASRRVGVELPWHPTEDRELDAAEVINSIVDGEFRVHKADLRYLPEHPSGHAHDAGPHEPYLSPYAVVNAPPRRVRRQRRGRSHQQPSAGAAG
eukprot:CAMPEP_0195086692 /NCGR_PEP_ID=MMETSP0448-20130528/26755_1 /TAXON_ID=66468 /ORGANISM="Heterocapsa triquestra, Strain CCMP 448" /LENGTH=307 /DNA_ID=CAMNT_0040120197 /DNA_START=88 /DNA_END=1007 /DNA_ORIENTATION=+